MAGHVINCTVPPFVPDGWSYLEEDQIPGRFLGKLAWNPDNILLRGGPVKPVRRDDRPRNLKEALEMLVGKPMLPANVLDFALRHQELIPWDWKGKHIHFCSVYRDAMNKKCVRCMFSDGVRSGWDVGYLSNDWCGWFVTATLKSRSRR